MTTLKNNIKERPPSFYSAIAGNQVQHGRPFFFLIRQEVRMGRLKTGEIIKFSAIDEFTGRKTELIGKILGNHEAVRKAFPIECAEVPKSFFLVEVDNYSGLFVVGNDQILGAVN